MCRQLRDRNMRIEARPQVCRKLDAEYGQTVGNYPPSPQNFRWGDWRIGKLAW